MYQTLEGSFSSVSKPIFATKYAFFKVFFETYKICTPSHLWNPKWKTTWRKTSRKIPKKTKELDPMEKSKRQKLQGKHGTRQKRCGVRRQRNGQRRKTFSCICVYCHRSEPKISAKKCHIFSYFYRKFSKFCKISVKFCKILTKF